MHTNSIGLFGYGPDIDKTALVESKGCAVLFRIHGIVTVVTSRALLHVIPDNFKPKFQFKLIDRDNNIHTAVFDATFDSFKYHPIDSESHSSGLAYITLKSGLNNFDLLELNFGQVFLPVYNKEQIQIATINNENLTGDIVHSENDSFNQAIETFKGKNLNPRETVELDGFRYDLFNQRIIEFEELPEEINQGGLVFTQNENEIHPLGIITTFGSGQTRQHYESTRKQIDFASYFHLSDLFEAILHNHGKKYSQMYISVRHFYQENVHQIRDEVERIADDIITDNIPKEEPTSDFIANKKIWLHQLRDELFSTRFNLFLIEQSLLNHEWWEISHRNDPPSDTQKEKFVSAYDTTIFRGFMISVFSVIEHCLRTNVRKIDSGACNNGRDSIHNIFLYLVSRLDTDKREEYETLFRLFRTIRNAIHNDGYYYPENGGEDLTINYNGRTYTFEDEKHIPIEWEDMLMIVEDASEFLVEFLDDDLVKDAFDNE